MVTDDYNARIKAMVIVVLFHYFAYLVFLALEVLQYPRKVHISYGFCKSPILL